MQLFVLWMHIVSALVLVVGFVAAGISVQTEFTEGVMGAAFLAFAFFVSAASTMRFPVVIEVGNSTLRCFSVWGLMTRRPYFTSTDRMQVLKHLEDPAVSLWRRVFPGVSARGKYAVKEWVSKTCP